jgi:uncharacterized SAM-binding protein YcdF (DUF218 family)
MGRRLAAAALMAGIAVAGYLAYIATMIHRQSQTDEAQPADVIIVLGAAEYRGRPSPVLKARLDHALELYRRNLAPRMMTTGGAGGDPVFTESTVGRDYLMKNGVPPEAIIVEPEGESTVHSTTAAAEIMQRMNLRSCLVVSDGYHIFRVKKILEKRGIRVYGSPRPAPPQVGWRHRWLTLRQAVGYLLWSMGIAV